MMLTRAWIYAFIDEKRGNTQFTTACWNYILAHFTCKWKWVNTRPIALQIKWHDLRACCTNFNDILNNITGMHKKWVQRIQHFNYRSSTTQDPSLW